MLCSRCNNNIDDSNTYCPICGAPQQPQQWQQPVQQPVQQDWDPSQLFQQNSYQQPAYQQNPYQQPAYPENSYQQPAYGAQTCPQCGNPMTPGARFCMVCGWSAGNVNPAPNQKAPKKYSAPAGKQGMKVGIIAGVAAVLVLLVVMIGAFTNWFGLTGPVMTIANATQKTLGGGNFTVEFSADMDYESMEGIAYVDIDMKKQIVNVLMELEVDSEEGTLAIYDEYLILESDGYYECIDIGDYLDTFFETYEKTGESELDWEDMLDEVNPYLYDEMKEYIDFDALNGCIKAYVKQLNNTGWMKKNAGYSTKNQNGVKLHILEPDIAVFLPASVPFFEDAAKNPDDYEEIVDSMDEIEDVADELSIYTAFGIKGGKLVGIIAEIEIDGEEVAVEATFSDIGKTKLDPEELEDFLKEAKENAW